MHRLQQFYIAFRRRPFDADLFGKIGHIQKSATVHTQIQECAFQIQYATNPVKHRHVTFKNLVDDVLAHKTLCMINVLYQSSLRKPSTQKVLVEMPYITFSLGCASMKSRFFP